MSPKPATAQIFELQAAESVLPPMVAIPQRAELLSFDEQGSLFVCTTDGREFLCDWLESSDNTGINLAPGDSLLVIPPSEKESGVALGRIGKYKQPQTQEHVTIEASESLTLKCGEASVELRKDGKAMVKGEDVLLRAKGTQRIRAASVAIN